MSDKPRNLPHTSPKAGDQAREQAGAYDSLFADTPIELDDGTTVAVPPHPDLSMLSDEAMELYEELQFEMESYDREEDIIISEQKLDNGIVLPGSVQKGALKRPYRKEGVLIKPPYSVRVAKIALGEAEYKRLVEGGRSSADVWRIWGTQAGELRKRQADDSKSDGGALDLEAVSATNSQ